MVLYHFNPDSKCVDKRQRCAVTEEKRNVSRGEGVLRHFTKSKADFKPDVVPTTIDADTSP
jgi:hypothetical protein